MSHHVKFNPDIITDLFNARLIEAPLRIRADLGEQHIKASLNGDGSVIIENTHYADLQRAMESTPRLPTSTSNVWQFWTWFSSQRQAWTPLEHARATLANKDRAPETRTSHSHPLRIDSVAVPGADGRIGLTFCPGKSSEGLYGGNWERNLEHDLKTIQAWGARVLVSLMEEHEFDLLGIADFMDILSASTFEWFHLPIKDMQIPDSAFEQQWSTIGPLLQQQLKAGESIVIHCRGGLGRTGLLAARMLVEAGISPVNAVADIRTARAHSIETYAQENYILSEQWKK
ncbi:putative protein-tyrosine phosphatase [hydrothermal vent metagenome]|uniref:protein-tyrosine-phosphatase n=1 Tax=hydrothermal vent metagenome TaxID=652676 RepID=A0A3B0XMM8_9ZZZZ